MVKIPRLEFEIQSAVTAYASAAAHVDGCILLVCPGKAHRSWVRRRVETYVSAVGAGIASDQRFAQIGLAATHLVDVIQVIEVNPMRTAVAQFHDRVLSHLLLQCETPELGLRYVDAGVRHAQFNRRKKACRAGQPQWPKIAIRDQSGAAYIARRAIGTDHSAGRGIKAGVIGHVAKVAFVANTKATA